MRFCDSLARFQAPKLPETLISPWLPVLSSINSQTSPSTWPHITMLALQPFPPLFSFFHLQFPPSSWLPLTQGHCHQSLMLLDICCPAPLACWPSLLPSPHPPLLAAAGGRCPGRTFRARVPSPLPAGDHPQPGLPDGRSFASCWLSRTSPPAAALGCWGCWQSRVWAALLELCEQMLFSAHYQLLHLLAPRPPCCVNYSVSLRIIFPTPAWSFRNPFQGIWS